MITMQKKMQQAAQKYPIVGFGAPQYMKRDELLREAFPDHIYIDLNAFEYRIYALDDPIGLLRNFGQNIILDNIQTTPTLLQVISRNIEKVSKGQIIYGVNFKIQRTNLFDDVLTKNVRVFELPNYSAKMLFEQGHQIKFATRSIISGNIPELINEGDDAEDFFSKYISELIEKDIQRIKPINDASKLIAMLRGLASHINTPIDIQNVADLCEVSMPTAREWLKVLNWFYIIYPIKPFPKNYGRRNKRTDYVYFCNTGIASRLLNIKTDEDYIFSIFRNDLARNAVVSATLAGYLNEDIQVQPYFWAEQGNHRIDLLLDTREKGVEGFKVYDASKLHKKIPDELKRFAKLSDVPLEQLRGVYPGDKDTTFEGVKFISWRNV